MDKMARKRAHRIIDESAARLRPAVLRLLAAAGDDVDARAVVRAGLSRMIDTAYQRWSVYRLGMSSEDFHTWVNDRIAHPPNDERERVDPVY